MRPLNHLLSALACAITVLATVAGAENAHENDSSDAQGADSANTAALLLESVERDDVDAVAALLARGVDVDAGARFRGAACCLTALGLAALRNRLDVTTLLIEAGADVDARGLDGGPTPLHWAAAERARGTAEALLAAGADVNAVAVNHHHRTPLHMAADRMFGGDGVAELLISRGANVNARTKSGETPLHQAVWWSKHRLATALLDAGADVDAMNVNGRTPLHFAAHRGADEAATVLLAAGATVDPPRRGNTPSPLLMAVRSKEEPLALLLIEHGADVGVGVDSGATLLALAEENGLYEVAVRILVRDDSFQVDDPSALLSAAVAADAFSTVSRLLEDGGDVNVKVDDWWDDEASLLHVAARHDSVSVARLLLDRGIDPDSRDGDGATPLHRAAWAGNHEIGAMLLDRGASVNARTEDELTPLHDAVHGMEPETAALLLERGADVNARDSAGWTPLHFALLGIGSIHHADVEIGLARKRKLVPVLIEHGADVNARTALAARTPLHLAVLLEEPEIVAALIQHGADVNAQTRLGGWTPLHLALNGCCADGIVAALRAAGGEDRAGGDADTLPMLSWGMDKLKLHDAPNPNAASRTDQTANLYSRPTMVMIGAASAAQGSFSAAGVNEHVVVEPVGWSSYLEELAYLTGLIDKDGQTRLLWVSDPHTELLTLCRDAETGTDHAIFSRWGGGNVAPDIVYMTYDAASGTLVESFVDWRYGEHFEDEMRERENRGMGSFACPWRDKQRYREAFRALEAGTWAWESSFDIDNEQIVLPARILSSEVVESSLAALRTLSAAVDAAADTPRWEIIIVEPDHSGHVGGPGGVVLVRDKERERWRSIYDCHHMDVLHQRADSLYAVLEEYCTHRYLGPDRIYEIDLSTLKAQRRREFGPS